MGGRYVKFYPHEKGGGGGGGKRFSHIEAGGGGHKKFQLFKQGANDFLDIKIRPLKDFVRPECVRNKTALHEDRYLANYRLMLMLRLISC